MDTFFRTYIMAIIICKARHFPHQDNTPTDCLNKRLKYLYSRPTRAQVPSPPAVFQASPGNATRWVMPDSRQTHPVQLDAQIDGTAADTFCGMQLKYCCLYRTMDSDIVLKLYSVSVKNKGNCIKDLCSLLRVG